MRKTAENIIKRFRTEVADDRRQPYQSTSTHIRSKRWKPEDESYKRGPNTKLHLAVDAAGKPVRTQLTAGTVADCSQAISFLEGLDIKVLLADKGYDTNAILDYTQKHRITAVIPPKRNRKVQREYDKDLYKLRHLVEIAFLYLKRWRGITTRYTKNSASFLVAIHICRISLAISSS